MNWYLILAIIIGGIGIAAYALRLLSKGAFPSATTFAEGQRALSLWLMAAAGIFQAVLAGIIIIALVRGQWGVDNFPKIIGILGWCLAGTILLQALVIGGLLVGGPVGRFNAKASAAGAEFDFGGKDAE